jgi:hypothetical protein
MTTGELIRDRRQELGAKRPHGESVCVDCGVLCDCGALRCRKCQDKHRTRPLAERFWEKVDRRGPNECWPWMASTNHRGYGVIGAGKGTQHAFAHRVAWELTNGPIPPGKCVCHRCDNPPCCNPAHGFLGTHSANMADAATKLRFPVGTKHWNAKLTEDEVRTIRHIHSTRKILQRELADRYGVTPVQISNIINRRHWRHL